ncbi:uncharacterized protein HKW66_Vig0093900 [Vigna angularis]|uniref:Uncharacterized protein n=1 Tax=Phaseolus angularis TaxID=3914 RepID=A0A8T0KM36_PHAAN|nr:uncharacterized protein HKW66_Vig0093900 [Vigna angularis]
MEMLQRGIPRFKMHTGNNHSRKPVEVLKTTPSTKTNASTQQPVSSITKINTLYPLASSESHQHHPPYYAFFQADQLLCDTTTEDEQACDPQPHAAESTGLKLLGLFLQCTECIAMDKLDFANDLLSEIAKCTFTSNVDNHGIEHIGGLGNQIRAYGNQIQLGVVFLHGAGTEYESSWNRIRVLMEPDTGPHGTGYGSSLSQKS